MSKHVTNETGVCSRLNILAWSCVHQTHHHLGWLLIKVHFMTLDVRLQCSFCFIKPHVQRYQVVLLHIKVEMEQVDHIQVCQMQMPAFNAEHHCQACCLFGRL